MFSTPFLPSHNGADCLCPRERVLGQAAEAPLGVVGGHVGDVQLAVGENAETAAWKVFLLPLYFGTYSRISNLVFN